MASKLKLCDACRRLNGRCYWSMAEKFSDKIGTVVISRIIFGDGAAKAWYWRRRPKEVLRIWSSSKRMPVAHGRR